MSFCHGHDDKMSRETGEIFLETCKDNKRDKPTLEEIIVRRVRKGTHVITDCWAAYGGLEELGPSTLLSPLAPPRLHPLHGQPLAPF